jgi:aminoglycoside phosphotransferase family enzyme/predicted kinase
VHRIVAAADQKGTVVEWAVEMTRMPDAQAAHVRLAEGRLGPDDVERIALALARFHAEAATDPRIAAFGSRAVIEGNVRESFAQTVDSAASYLDETALQKVRDFQLGFLAEHGERLEQRAATGRVRDGHGDLRLEHCYLDEQGGVTVLDCIEFNERFRYGDVCADLAFLSMDLEHQHRHDLAERLLGCYAQQTGDYDLYALVDFYESYRAYVRAKVMSMLADDAGASAEARAVARKQAHTYYLLAEACACPPLEPPVLYAVGGVIGAGKSTIARKLSRLHDAPVIEADRTRKELLGVAPVERLNDAPFEGRYDAATTARTYAELLRRAQVVVRSGRSAVLDASFRARANREAARALADQLGVPFRFVECVAPLDVCRARLAQRALDPARVSDGRGELLDDFAREFEQVEELAPEQHLRLDTTLSEAARDAQLREL